MHVQWKENIIKAWPMYHRNTCSYEFELEESKESGVSIGARCIGVVGAEDITVEVDFGELDDELTEYYSMYYLIAAFNIVELTCRHVVPSPEDVPRYAEMLGQYIVDNVDKVFVRLKDPLPDNFVADLVLWCLLPATLMEC
jgi:hypothetical protein